MSLMKVAAIVGMTGSGKSEVARLFEESGFSRIRFGDITDEEVKKRGLVLNEANERRVRELLRDGLYSWEEYLLLKEHYGVDFYVIAVWASPQTRYARLSARPVRPLTAGEAASRDRAEIENLNKGGPIAIADFTIINESTREDLRKPVQAVIACIGGHN
jgi:dephospho-CoA kinase